MKESIVIGLIRNIAILLTFSILYDHFWASRTKAKNFLFKVLAGVLLAGVVIILIITPWNYDKGIFFDTRSVMLSISGLFFGPVPTIVAMIISAGYRIYLGGSGVYMGVAVIFSSGLIGVLWNIFRPDWRNHNDVLQLSTLGVVVHVVMLGCTLLLPPELRLSTFREILFSVLILYPFATVLLGKYIIRQDKSRNNKVALAESEKRWQFALEGAGDGIWDWNMETSEVYFSTQWKNMLGYNEDEIENKLEEWEKRIHLDDVVAVHAEINKHLMGLTPVYSSEHRLLCKDGTYKWVLDRGKVMQFDNDGKPLRFIGTHKDISDRKEKELQLAYERFLLDSLMDFTPESIYFKDLDSKFIRANKTAAINLGCNEVSEIIGKSDFDFYDKEMAERCFQTEQEIIKTGIPYHAEEHSQSKNGKENWGITNKMPLLDPNGTVIGTFGVSVNINELKQAETALRESEEYTKSILQAIPDLIFIMDSNAAFLDYRTSSEEMLAFPKEFFLQKSVLEVFPNKLGIKFRDAIKTVIDTQQNLTIEYDLEANGTSGNYECYLFPFSNKRVIAIVHNVTVQKQNEEELRISRNQLKNFAAHLQDVREEERVLLAREIHDDLGQILVALKIDIGIFKQQVLKNIDKAALQDVQGQIDKIYNLVDTTIKTTRKIMTGLRPEVLELIGFQESVRLYIEEFKNRYKLTCKCDCPEQEVSVDPEKSIALFRILQEALTNIAKHANATEIEVSLQVVDNKLNMRIADNGVGLDQNKEARQDSYGLIGMKERVYLLDGKLSITSAPGEGTTVFVEMPYQN